MACKNQCRLCRRLILSTAVTYTAPNLIITIPEGSYLNCEKYCITVAQAIPAATTRDATVVIQIGDGAVLYPLTNCNGTQLTARYIDSRTKYSTVVHTTADSGTFKLLGRIRICCSNSGNLASINGDGTPVTPATPAAGA